MTYPFGRVVECDRQVDGMAAGVEAVKNALCFLTKQILIGDYIGQTWVVGMNRGGWGGCYLG